LARLLWTQKQDFGPSPRLSHALAFDSNRSRVVMFGGETAIGPPTVLVGDTWEWDGGNWTQVEDIGPSARKWFAMAYDRNRNRLVLFGGLTASGASGETWEWDGQDWTQVSETGPQARVLHAMAFDSSKNVVTLFGGQLQAADPAQQAILNDTWEWNGQDWTQQEDTGPNRCAHAMAYDDTRKRLVLFGGIDAQSQEHGDTWEWDGATWTQRTDFGPPACSNPSLVFTGAECVLFGGTHSGVNQKQTWTWDGTHWTARQDIGPSARTGDATAFDSVRQRVVLFGGLDQTQSPLGDTWEQNADAGQATGTTMGTTTGPITLSSFTVTAMTQSPLDSLTAAFSGQASVQLSGPAPDSGAVITLSVPPSYGVTLTVGMQTTIPAGQTTMQIPINGTRLVQVTINSVAFTATLQNGNSLQATAQITGAP